MSGRGCGSSSASRVPDLDHVSDLARCVDLPELREAAHLPLEVAARPRERGERRIRHIGCVDLDQRVDELVAEPPPRGRVVEARRQPVGDDVAVEERHHVERDAEHALVLAHREDRRQPDALRRERELEPRLAHHVVGRGRQGWPWGPAQHEALASPFEQEGEVRPAADPDPRRAQRPLSEAVPVEERLHPVQHEQGLPRRAGCLGRSRNDVVRLGHGAIVPRPPR